MKTPAQNSNPCLSHCLNHYSELVREHQSALRNTLRRWTGFDHSLADDLAQETFLRAYQKLHQFNGAARFSTWLYRIAFTIYLNHKAKHPQPMTSLEDVGDNRLGDDMQRVKTSHDIERAFAQLTEPQQLCLHLCLQREFSHSEAAEILALPVGTVKTHVKRGRQQLQILLADYDINASELAHG
ncbi:sigma-70 family RNA polymerase sigma factor [Simiduia curdlanivorans]|uniref:RNA polymerase sigma factor n=1 Tax=Simiduia curdlanivorans TaxID=1492769 RepID=A0ABV8V8H9_9GAMM|nr:sigma-70 family RNA polymerase sigma factor [Simiduia curdlanivorans]MDN3638708.1 sigma-70 family RNA polymerase sigma factor [Simiduia curdlanivorans]